MELEIGSRRMNQELEKESVRVKSFKEIGENLLLMANYEADPELQQVITAAVENKKKNCWTRRI